MHSDDLRTMQIILFSFASANTSSTRLGMRSVLSSERIVRRAFWRFTEATRRLLHESSHTRRVNLRRSNNIGGSWRSTRPKIRTSGDSLPVRSPASHRKASLIRWISREHEWRSPINVDTSESWTTCYRFLLIVICPLLGTYGKFLLRFIPKKMERGRFIVALCRRCSASFRTLGLLSLRTKRSSRNISKWLAKLNQMQFIRFFLERVREFAGKRAVIQWVSTLIIIDKKYEIW